MLRYQNLIDRATYVRQQANQFRHDVRKRSKIQENELLIPRAEGLTPIRLVFEANSASVINYYRPKTMNGMTILHLQESLRDKIRLYRKFIDTEASDAEVASLFVINTRMTADDAHLLRSIVDRSILNDSDGEHIRKINEMLDQNVVMTDEAFDILHNHGYRMTVLEHMHGVATGNIHGRLHSPPRGLPALTTWPPYFTNADTVEAYAKFSITSLSVLVEGANIAGVTMRDLLWWRHVNNIESTLADFVSTVCEQLAYIPTPNGADQLGYDRHTWNMTTIDRSLDAKTCETIHAIVGSPTRKYTCLPLEASAEWWDQMGDDEYVINRRVFSENCESSDHSITRVSHLFPADELFMMYPSLYRGRCTKIANAVASDWRDNAFVPGGYAYHLAVTDANH